jgi:hypothetical protein
MSALMDVWHTIHAIVTTADYWTLGIAVVVVLVAGFMIEGLGAVVGTTFWALIAFALLGYVRAVTVGKQDFSAYATTEWHNFLALPMLTLIAYFVIFAVLIGVVHLIRSAIR